MLQLDPTEQWIARDEASNRPFVGTGGADLSTAPLDPSGFPIWPGIQGPAGRSHAAGLFQMQPDLWHEFARPGEVFSNVDDQIAVERRVRAARGLTPWVPYNPRLARDLGMKGYGTGIMPGSSSPGTTANYPDVDYSALRDHSLAALGGGNVASANSAGALPDRPLSASPAASSNWSRLMAFSMIKQLSALGTHKFEPVDYDPWKVAQSGQAG